MSKAENHECNGNSVNESNEQSISCLNRKRPCEDKDGRRQKFRHTRLDEPYEDICLWCWVQFLKKRLFILL